MEEYEVNHFSHAGSNGTAADKNQLGGKGANLAEMGNIGLPVPPGFTIPTEFCRTYMSLKNDNVRADFMNDVMHVHVVPAYDALCSNLGYAPLVSVRSGARVSMPGMMDTVLNVGLSEDTLEFWKDRIGSCAAMDSYCRLMYMYLDVVDGRSVNRMNKRKVSIKEYKYGLKHKPTSESQYNEKHHQLLLNWFTKDYLWTAKRKFPTNVHQQLRESIEAVFKSWDSDRAKHYRKMYKIPAEWGTAVNIQTMVFGNMNDQSCSGVLFTRNPSSGENEVMGEFLPKAQGEDVVAGIRTPQPLEDLVLWNEKINDQLLGMVDQLEGHYGDMQDVEFTVEDGKLYLLQTRNGKRTDEAAFRIASDMVEDGELDVLDAVSRVTYEQYKNLNTTKIKPEFTEEPDLQGIAASNGIVTGYAALSSKRAEELGKTTPVILVTRETTPEDIKGMDASVGILTKTGGATCHAAVVARGMNKGCVVGATDMNVYLDHFELNGECHPEGTKIVLDGSTGRVWIGKEVPVSVGTGSPYADKLAANAAKSKNLVLKVDAKDVSKQETFPDEVYLVTGSLDMEPEADTMLRQAMEHLEVGEVSRVYVDTRRGSPEWESTDEKFYAMFGGSSDNSEGSYEKCKGLESYNGSLREKTVVLGETKQCLSGYQKETLVTSVAGLVYMDAGIVKPAKSLLESVDSEHTLASLLAVFQKAGRDIRLAPTAVLPSELASMVFAK